MIEWDIIKDLIEKDPFIKYLGIKINVIDTGKAEAILDLKEYHMRTGNMMNGGAIATMMDTAGGTAVITMSKSNQVTTNLNINYLRPIIKSPAKAVGEVIKEGKRVYFVKISVYDGDNNLCAFGTGTWYILRD
jgi:uncharacterized protein (TIGR00369 family)